MGLKTELKSLVDELDSTHNGTLPWSNEPGLPEFVTAGNGLHRFFNRRARRLLSQLSETLYRVRPQDLPDIQVEAYRGVVRQAVADMHAADEFLGFNESDPNGLALKLKSLVNERLEVITSDYVHHFPAWTLGFEKASPFSLGPVTVLSRADWIASVNFPENVRGLYLPAPEADNHWKDTLNDALSRPMGGLPPPGLAGTVYRAIVECPALIKVPVKGAELEGSRKLAKLAARTALDAISLGFGWPGCFQQQALQEERLPPVSTSSFVETNGLLWLPGRSLGDRVHAIDPQSVNKWLLNIQPVLPAFAAILEGLVNPPAGKHPKLTRRWATALDWFGEGNRESNDAIALAKLATSLDVLSCGGKYSGIRDMVVHLTGTAEGTNVGADGHPPTLEQLVKSIYDHGRSEILHGNRCDWIESFFDERQNAAQLTRIVLIESAVRLQTYSGPDQSKAFRTI